MVESSHYQKKNYNYLTNIQNNMKEKNSGIPINQEEIQLYLKDIRKIKVMTPDRERELSKLISSGNLTEKELESINKELLEGNLRFVITVAKQYQNQGLDFPDLIAEGNLGLMKAISHFDWSRDLRFISYAVWWVKQSILQSLNDNARTIRLPVNVVQDLQRAKKEIESTGGKLSDKFQNLPSIVDLDMNINEDGDTLVDIIKNEQADMPDAIFNTKDELKQQLISLLDVLDNREKTIVGDYFGLTGTPRTLEDIGGDFNLTKERVRQIKEKALRKLRNESSILFDYM
jgi:RNA polymerase primary sigma factor